MIACPNCGHTEPPGALFCTYCGSQLPVSDPDSGLGSRDPTIQFPQSPGEAETSAQESDSGGRRTIPIDRATGSDEGAPRVKLHFLDAEETVPLEGAPEYTLGRISSGQSLIPEVDLSRFNAYEHGVSRLHAVIGFMGDGVTITDLGSANGTRVNGKRISPHTPYPLKHGDVISLGTLKMQTLVPSP